MNIDKDAADRKIALAEAATKEGKVFFGKEDTIADFNKGCEHVCLLLEDAFKLFETGSFSTSIFIAITAIEETAKLEIAGYRREGKTGHAKRKKDPLFDHKKKHAIALQEVIMIESRLLKAIGEARLRELVDLAESGGLLAMRGASLYFDNVADKFTTPRERFSKKDSWEILLLALEVWCDRIVGMSDYTFELDTRMDELFKELVQKK